MRELEAAIEANPDDPAPYAVYADWLQSQGDPRGELIALQTASWRAPGDKKLARLASRFLATHADIFISNLDEQVAFEWHCGFMRAARFRAADKMARRVRSVIEHPSGRFLQSIVIADAYEPYERIVEMLLDVCRPVTLVELRIARAWKGEDIPALREAFPRLGDGLAPDWRQLQRAIGDERKGDLKYTFERLPALVPILDVADTPIDLIARGLKLELEGTREFRIVSAMLRSFTTESLDQFAIALAQQFFQGDTTPTRRWGFDTLGAFGDEASAKWIGSQFARWSHPRAQQGLEHLSSISKRTPTALAVILALSEDKRVVPELRNEVRGRLETIAAFRKLDLSTLAERVPTVVALTPNAIARGMRVQWKKQFGVVFWIGKGKHGGGTRVGITEDGTGETLWANETDCRPA